MKMIDDEANQNINDFDCEGYKLNNREHANDVLEICQIIGVRLSG